MLRLAFAALLLVGCSDDTKQLPDQGTKKDQQIGKDLVVDKGPAREAGTKEATVVDKGKTPDGAQAKKVEEYVPKDNEAASWVEDTGVGKPGVEAGYTKKDIEDIIDGSNDPYAAEGENGFAKQDYKKGAFTLSLFLWDMKTAAGAKKMYDKNKLDGEQQAGLKFDPIAGAADGAVIANDNPDWRVYHYKSHYIAKIISRFPDPKDADALKPDVIAFVKHLASKLP
jgi:hypothetical protein